MTGTWYRDGPLVAVVQEAVSSNVEQTEIVDVLSERRFPNATRRRIEAIVAGAVERRTSHPGQASPSQSTQSNEPSRSVPARFVDYADIEYLGDREFSHLVALILEYFDGSTTFPLLDALDLLWNRKHTSVGIQTVATQNHQKTLDAIQEIATGKTNPPDARSPSRLVVVTAANIDEELTDEASDVDVELCGRGQVARWLRIARLPPSSYGPLLEKGEQSSFDAQSVLEELPPLPSRVKGRDPLAIEGWTNAVDIDTWMQSKDRQNQPSAFEDTAEDTHSSTPSTGNTRSNTSSRKSVSNGRSYTESSRSPKKEKLDFDAQPAKGKYGRLYADSNEDGDIDSIDEWVDGLEEVDS